MESNINRRELFKQIIGAIAGTAVGTSAIAATTIAPENSPTFLETVNEGINPAWDGSFVFSIPSNFEIHLWREDIQVINRIQTKFDPARLPL